MISRAAFRAGGSLVLALTFLSTGITFAVPGPPTPLTGDAFSRTPTAADLFGEVNPNGATTTAHFEFGTTTNYGSISSGMGVSNGTNAVAIALQVGPLTAGTTYHYRVVASNSHGVAFGTNRTFVTSVFGKHHDVALSTSFNKALWGDYDSDGDLDILLTGQSSFASQLWNNQGNGSYTQTAIALPKFSSGEAAWVDFDGDHDLDISFVGAVEPYTHSALWRNGGNGTFTDAGFALPAVGLAAAGWGDSDNDGDLDLFITGTSGFTNSPIAQLWINNGAAGFSNANIAFPAVTQSGVAWGDYDNDGDHDFAYGGVAAGGVALTRIFRNDGAYAFTSIPVPKNISHTAIHWGDYDNDNDLDLLISGWSAGVRLAEVWRNDGNDQFTLINSALPNINGTGVWGDYDNDGLLDVLLSGTAGPTGGVTWHTQVWRNNGNDTFSKTDELSPLAYSADWGDFNNDGRLDILLAGTSTNGVVAEVWRNFLTVSNDLPSAPTGLKFVATTEAQARLSWNESADAQTSAKGLGYNLRLGTTPGGSEIVAAHATSSGYRTVPQLGTTTGTNALLNLTNGVTYYWSVQAIDSALAGSPFAPEQSFVFLGRPRLNYLGSGQVGFSGYSNVTYSVWASSDLTAWELLGNATQSTPGEFLFQETPGSNTNRFFQVGSP